MDKKVWWHPFELIAIKRKFCKDRRKPSVSTHRLNSRYAAYRDGEAKITSKLNPWRGMFDDPALHEALDRIMASNGIA